MSRSGPPSRRGLPGALLHAAQRMARQWRAVVWRAAHRGTDRRCPCCGTQVSRFMPYGAAHRPDAQCPGCGSLERHRALWLWLRAETAFLESALRVLVVAPDPYLERVGRARHPAYLSIDLEPGLAMEAMDLTRLPLPADDRDLLIAYHVLEHIPDDAAAIREIARVLRRDGVAVLEVPLRDGETDEAYRDAGPDVRAQHYGQPDHVRLYGRDDFPRRLARADLDAEPVVVGERFADAVEWAGLERDETFFVVRHRPAPA